MIESMFHLPLPLLEKILRPVFVYLILVGFLRLFGKRELAQLNPFDLVVLLSLSNTVQNAMIGVSHWASARSRRQTGMSVVSRGKAFRKSPRSLPAAKS